ncbi:DNA-binding protein Fis [Kushneria sinocarnis]|uniref:Putative Fis-like DNA-binding protein n=2 Tax=Kushneria sinocarnis TaxID=595502 RepID=A0A420WYV2_9GAMM|nr:DNA-binding transcriptional regulator Fis [Kushneria sinocarnis]RKR06424.1 DNA-binding protein Fis [Kushneria sinocarnis]
MTTEYALTPNDRMRQESSASAPEAQTLREAVERAMTRYFDHLDGETVTDLYPMVLAEVEAPLLRSVMAYTNGNQTQASSMLGLNRGTLRKKLKQYDLI